MWQMVGGIGPSSDNCIFSSDGFKSLPSADIWRLSNILWVFLLNGLGSSLTAHCKHLSLIKLSESHSYTSAPPQASHRRGSTPASDLQAQLGSSVPTVTAEVQVMPVI